MPGTAYRVSAGEQAVRHWKELVEALITRCNDGYVKDESGRPQEAGYPKAWLCEVVKTRPGQFNLPGDGIIASPEPY